MEVDKTVKDDTNELVQLFKRMLYVALDRQQKALR